LRRVWLKATLVALDLVLLSLAYVSAFYLRLGWEGLEGNLAVVARTLPVVLAVSFVVHMRLGLFHAMLRYASIDTAAAVLKAVCYSVVASSVLLFLLFRLDGVPRTVFVIYGMAALLLVGASRLVVRWRCNRQRPNGETKGVVLYGANDTAELVLRGLQKSPGMEYAAVGLIDRDSVRHGRLIHGVKIHGGLGVLRDVAALHGAEELWVCVPGIAGEELRKVYEAASAVSLRVKILPRLESALLGADLGRFHEPDIADLLRRPPRHLDRERMQRWISGRRVLITGAGGSIGSELASQVAGLGPQSLALCDACESKLFEVHSEMARLHGGVVERPFLVDVRDEAGVGRMFEEARPDIVFHAAAYKHVPMVELNPCEGVLTNVKGLYNVARASIAHAVKDFVFISTDKAVRPASVMGATKRLGELIVQALNREGATRFSAVRFGNVLGSSGSVVPIFQEQIRRGGPVTVTHPEMTRYFMLVSEAVELVIQAGSMERGGEVFVLDMGEPVRIADMARDLIRLMGKEPDKDVKIVYTGCRPGEKLHEELLVNASSAQVVVDGIWVEGNGVGGCGENHRLPSLHALIDAARGRREDAVLVELEREVPGGWDRCTSVDDFEDGLGLGSAESSVNHDRPGMRRSALKSATARSS
jgi:FlaA1/EpsC-like NDP-sugar epimerase